jgi:hypothetical protein
MGGSSRCASESVALRCGDAFCEAPKRDCTRCDQRKLWFPSVLFPSANFLWSLFERKSREYGQKSTGVSFSRLSCPRDGTLWRRERDSNPRYPFEYNGFQDRRFQPLTHPSAGGTANLLTSLQQLSFSWHASRTVVPGSVAARGSSAIQV